MVLYVCDNLADGNLPSYCTEFYCQYNELIALPELPNTL